MVSNIRSIFAYEVANVFGVLRALMGKKMLFIRLASDTGLEKVLYPGILVTSQFPIWQPIFGWVENDASRYMRVDSRLLARPMTQPAIKH